MSKPLPDLDELLDPTDTLVLEDSEEDQEEDVEDLDEAQRRQPFLT